MSTHEPERSPLDAVEGADRRERLIAVGSIVVVVAIAAVVFLVLRQARDNGIDALEDAVSSQVAATASSFDSRVVSAIQGVAALGTDWELTEGSEVDLARMQSILLDPDALSGAFLVDADGTITQGVLLTNAEVGDRYEPSDLDRLFQTLEVAPAIVTDIEPAAVTTDLPVFGFVIGIRDPEAPERGLLGAFVLESAVHPESSFNQEISRLAGDGESESWYFVDSAGAVIASTDPDALGQVAPLPLDRLRDEPGFLRADGQVYASAAVPSVGWQVVFTDDRGAFESALADPLQVVGFLVAAVLLAIGITFVVVLQRRLAASREEERRIRALASSQEEFISIVSHELRTPVAGVLGFLQSSLDHWEQMSEDERLHAMRRAVSNARRLQALTRDVLDAESVEAGRLSFDFQRTDLREELTQAKEAADGLDGRGTVELSVPEEPVWAEADPDRIQQVLTNLLDNAHEHSPPDQPVSVTLRREGRSAVLEVTDRGAGIDPETLDKIFDKFVRGRTETVSGTGLGLYICRQIVSAHGGEIDATSGPSGTTFRVELPVSELAETPAATAEP